MNFPALDRITAHFPHNLPLLHARCATCKKNQRFIADWYERLANLPDISPWSPRQGPDHG